MRRSVVPVVAIVGALSLGLAGAAPALASGPPSDNPDMGGLTSISANVYQVGVIGDIEGDGDNDIAVASGATDTFQFFINDGGANPTFTPSAVHSLPATCGSLRRGPGRPRRFRPRRRCRVRRPLQRRWNQQQRARLQLGRRCTHSTPTGARLPRRARRDRTRRRLRSSPSRQRPVIWSTSTSTGSTRRPSCRHSTASLYIWLPGARLHVCRSAGGADAGRGGRVRSA